MSEKLGEQPAQGEPRRRAQRMEAGKGVSAEQLAMDILIDYGRDPSLLESRVTKVAEMIERHAALKVRERDEAQADAFENQRQEIEALKCEKGELREERDALRYKYEHDCNVEIASVNQNIREYCEHWEGRAERAESALVEARDKALDEAAALYREHFYCAEYSDTSEAYLADLSKLKGPR